MSEVSVYKDIFMSQNEQNKDPFQIMEQKLLPVFKEAVSIAKEVSHNPNYFKDDYKASRCLYAMAIVSMAINAANKNNCPNEQKKKNIERIDLYDKQYFYTENDTLGRKENIFERAEIQSFKHEMRDLHAEYFNDAHIQECIGCVEMDAAVGMWNENQAIISPEGKILDWKKASKSNIFKFAVSNIKNNMFTHKMNKASQENKWDKKAWNANYPIVNRECEKTIELEIAKYCQNKQTSPSLDLSRTR